MDLLLMTLLAWSLFLALVSVIGWLGYPLLRRLAVRIHPAPRAQFLRVLLAAPVIGAGLAVGICFAPKLLALVRPQLDHCAAHGHSHAHLCLIHPPQLTASLWSYLLVAGIGAGLLVISARRWWRFRASRRVLGQLAGTARFDDRSGSWLVESELPVALSIGLLRPRTLLSTGLLSLIPPRLVEAIVEHERAHGRRRDGLWKLATEMLSLGHLPWTRRWIRQDLEVACEQACDEEAGARLGDRTRIAEALLAMERVRQGVAGLGPAAVAFGSHALVARIESLTCDDAGSIPDRRLRWALVACSGLVIVLAANPLHDLTESLLHFILR